MAARIDVYVEVAKRRTFAAAIDWPGWCRSGKTQEDAVEALAEYAGRYRRAVGRTAGGLKVPRSGPSFDVVERVKGNATTEFGAPGVVPAIDEGEIPAERVRRLLSLLKAAWRTFDATATGARGRPLQKGAKGGGRSLGSIVDHV